MISNFVASAVLVVIGLVMLIAIIQFWILIILEAKEAILKYGRRRTIAPQAPIVTTSRRTVLVQRIELQRPSRFEDRKNGQGVYGGKNRCRHCGRIAMYDSDECYAHHSR